MKLGQFQAEIDVARSLGIAYLLTGGTNDPSLYLLAVAGFRRARGQLLAGLLAAIFVAHLLVVAIVGADWDGRYLLFGCPLLCVFSANGLPRRLFSKERRRDAASHTSGGRTGVSS